MGQKITCLGVKSCEHQTLSQILTPGSPVKRSGRQVLDQVSRPVLLAGQGFRAPNKRMETKKPMGFMEPPQKSKRLMYRIERQKGEDGPEGLFKGITAGNSASLGRGIMSTFGRSAFSKQILSKQDYTVMCCNQTTSQPQRRMQNSSVLKLVPSTHTS